MSLTADARFGPYRILSLLGVGGMGEVYRARDTRLERDVALKVMTASAAVDADRRARFEREARAIAALNHPNIVSVYDFGEQDGALFIVAELIEGESLRKRIGRGMIGSRELLNLAVQMADGISAAHQSGIVHRDLKPDNVMVTPEGRVKILDFGLARQACAAAAPDHTVTINNTLPGTIMGTVNYMSPEQARGVEASYRSDQFSFGIILYEMASGAHAFARETTPQTLTAILVEEPKPLDAKIPTPLRWTIARCLSKDPVSRYESTRDLYHDLRNQLEHLSELSVVSGEIAPAPITRRSSRDWIALALGATVIGAVSVLGTLVFAPKPRSVKNDLYTPIEISLEGPADAAWSPDGKAFTYSALIEGKRQIFVRYLNSPLSTRLTNLSSDAFPIGWASDGKRIFLAAANPAGGQPRRALFSLSIAGGEPELLMPLDVIFNFGTVEARVSPDGNVLLARRRESDGMISLSISSPVGSAWKRYSPAPFESRQSVDRPSFGLSPDGKKIVYFLNNAVDAQAWLLPFPPGTGTPKMILPSSGDLRGMSWFPDSRHIAASYTVLSYFSARVNTSPLWALDIAGEQRKPVTAGLVHESSPAVSPDGKRILFLESTSEYRIVAASLKDASLRTWIRSQMMVGMPLWADRGERFVYDTSAHGEAEIWLHESDGAERPVLTQSAFAQESGRFMNPALSPDGSRLAVMRIPSKGVNQIWIASAAGGTPVRLTNDSGIESMAAWSPDSARIVYRQLKEGTNSVMIAKTSGQATPTELVRDAANPIPDWSPTAEWIVYSSAAGVWSLISPDGKDKRDLGKIATQHLTFSKDGKTLYGIRAEGEHQYLFSWNIASGQMKTIGDVGSEFAPRSYLNPGIRFSVSPDGESVLYPTYSVKTGLWMLEGFDQP
jgi:serine/threonine protein kinase